MIIHYVTTLRDGLVLVTFYKFSDLKNIYVDKLKIHVIILM